MILANLSILGKDMDALLPHTWRRHHFGQSLHTWQKHRCPSTPHMEAASLWPTSSPHMEGGGMVANA